MWISCSRRLEAWASPRRIRSGWGDGACGIKEIGLRPHACHGKFGPIEHANLRNWETIGGLYRHLRGLIDFAKMVEPTYAVDSLNRLNQVKWPT